MSAGSQVGGSLLPPADAYVPPGRSLPQRVARRLLRRVGRHALGTITHVETAAPVAALTFDDGPDPETTPRLLDLLKRYDARATFFMLGKQALRHPQLVEQIAWDGHCIANHSFDHPSFPALPRRERLRQIRACEAAIAPFGHKLFRPPRGLQSVASRIDALLLGYHVITWNAVIRDWEVQTAGSTVDRLQAEVKPGSIVLLHDLLYEPDTPAAADRRAVFAGLDLFLERNGRRLSFVTVPELLRHGQPHHAGWFVHSDSDWELHDPS